MRNSFGFAGTLALTLILASEIGLAQQEADTAGTQYVNEGASETWTSSTVERRSWSSGFDLVFVKPHFNNNPEVTRLESDGVTFDAISTTDFSYQYELTPRIWVRYETEMGVGLRTSFWQFNNSSNPLTANPPANGFGQLSLPDFGGVDIGSTIPTDQLTLSSGINAYNFDLEVTKAGDFGVWSMTASAGIRYASISQRFDGLLRNGAGILVGSIDYDHFVRGIGPTLGFFARRPVTTTFSAFSAARASLLFGEGRSRLVGGEDLDLAVPFFTTRTTSRDAILPIGELQIGCEWAPQVQARFQPFVRSSVEGQLWGNVGNASSENGSLGFVGISIGAGVTL